MPQSIDQALKRLGKSSFRSSFHLSAQDIAYIDRRGWDVIRSHAEDFVRQRLSDAFPRRDGKQTPMKGHPVFVAMHACACCCRGCLQKWYKVRQGVPLTDAQQAQIVRLLMAWLRREYDRQKSGV